jgi:hypothetical protein
MERGEGIIFQRRGQGVVGFVVVRELREFNAQESKRSKHGKRQEDGIKILCAEAGVAEDECAERAEARYPRVYAFMKYNIQAPLSNDSERLR